MKTRRGGFTLFELILAIALSAALLALIGAAINLYLTRVDTSRARVEEAQLARSILSMIADDIRATTVYQPQDTSAIAQLMLNGTPFDVDSIDDARSDTSGSATGAGGLSPTGGTSSFGSSTSSGSGTTGMSGSSSSSSSSSSSTTSAESDSTMPLGLNGSLNEMYVDVTRLPRREELFSTVTGYTNAPMPKTSGFGASASVVSPGAGVVAPSDLKTIRYFIRQGEQVAPGGVAATSLSPELQSRAGGLVRQEIARPLRLFAEETGDTAILESGQSLIAPEVVYVEFRYYDGQQTTDVWDMVEEGSLPLAIEVTIWLTAADSQASASTAGYSSTDLANRTRKYRETVFLPMAEASKSGGGGGGGESSSSSSSSSESTSSGFGSSSSSESGSGFGQQ